MGVVYRSVRHLPPYPHPPILKEVPIVHQGFSSVTAHLPPFRPSHGPTNFYNDCKGREADGSHKGSQTSSILRRLAYKGPIAGGTIEYSDHGGPNKSLRWISNQEKSELKPTQVFSIVRYEYHLDSALVKHTQDRWLKLQDLILHLKSKLVLTARCLMLLIGLLASTEKMVPEGHLHMRPFQWHLKEHWRYPQSWDILFLKRVPPCLPLYYS